MGKRKLFCELGPLCYHISLAKEFVLRDAKDVFSGIHMAKERISGALPNIVKGHRSPMLRRLEGVDMELQRNKIKNLELAGKNINGLLIRPGESFSFWKTVGSTTAKKGYLDGLNISSGKLGSGVGGGLCQLANMINWLVLNSPLTVTEVHHHSDALFPDSERRVPFGTGTSVFYKNIDYRFRNDTDQDVQLLIWISDGDLCGELRSRRPFAHKYRIVEEDSHYSKEGDDYFRISHVYQLELDADRTLICKKMVLNNHSKVMYDCALIPQEEIEE